MGVWIPQPAVAADERVEFTAVANTFQGRRSIGGRVTVTNRRLLFTLNRLDLATGGRTLAVDRQRIGRVWLEQAGVGTALKRGLGASVRPQVGVEHSDGTTFITMRRPETLLTALQRNAPGGRQ